eukprot:TRINITY_DN1402_c0_g3_i1.p1 TRINITY_DN1402_c0_g3~~TRINITY_DN1402_c0_g3_i1.p1  ORF type:complete len:171 (+),score=3.31 TRINITY_DN1402_c0_g3_i1:24-536(+)
MSSIGKTTTISIKNSIGKEITRGAYNKGMISLMQNQGIITLIGLGVISFPEIVASFYVNKDTLLNEGMMSNYRSALILQVMNQFFLGLANTTAASLRGIGQLTTSTLPEVAFNWIIGLSLSYILVNYYDYGVQGAITGPLVANFLLSLFLQIHWWSSYLAFEEIDSKKDI